MPLSLVCSITSCCTLHQGEEGLQWWGCTGMRVANGTPNGSVFTFPANSRHSCLIAAQLDSVQASWLSCLWGWLSTQRGGSRAAWVLPDLPLPPSVPAHRPWAAVNDGPCLLDSTFHEVLGKKSLLSKDLRWFLNTRYHGHLLQASLLHWCEPLHLLLQTIAASLQLCLTHNASHLGNFWTKAQLLGAPKGRGQK